MIAATQYRARRHGGLAQSLLIRAEHLEQDLLQAAVLADAHGPGVRPHGQVFSQRGQGVRRSLSNSVVLAAQATCMVLYFCMAKKGGHHIVDPRLETAP